MKRILSRLELPPCESSERDNLSTTINVCWEFSLDWFSVALSLISLALAVVFYFFGERKSREGSEYLLNAQRTLDKVDSTLIALRDESFALVRESQSDFRTLVMSNVAVGGSRTESKSSNKGVKPRSGAKDDHGANTKVSGVDKLVGNPLPQGDLHAEDILALSLDLGKHMRARRGASFQNDLDLLTAQIRKFFTNLPDGTEFVSNGEVIAGVRDARATDGSPFDPGEVVYAIAMTRLNDENFSGFRSELGRA